MGKWEWGLGLACVAAIMASPLSADAQTPALMPDTTDACPPPVKRAPVYPIEMMRRGQGGTVLLRLAIDACGRVQQVEVKQGSGRKQLDDAAVTAAMHWVLAPPDRDKAVSGRVELPVSFGMSPDQSIPYAKLDWPKSHQRPHYRLEPMLDFGSADEVSKTIKVPVDRVLKPPYPGVMSQFFRNGETTEPEYWLFIYKARTPNLAVRYRLIDEATEPTVVLSIACDDQPEACAKASDFLMRGLPFARAR